MEIPMGELQSMLRRANQMGLNGEVLGSVVIIPPEQASCSEWVYLFAPRVMTGSSSI